jgi:hypothetical protein
MHLDHPRAQVHDPVFGDSRFGVEAPLVSPT